MLKKPKKISLFDKFFVFFDIQKHVLEVYNITVYSDMDLLLQIKASLNKLQNLIGEIEKSKSNLLIK